MATSIEILKFKEEVFKNYCYKRMTAKKEFKKLFYEVLYWSAFEGKDLSHRQVFTVLNELYLNLTGKLRYTDYGSFLIDKIRIDPGLLN